MVTFHCGLYSSLLAAASKHNPGKANKAIQQADFLQNLLRRIVFNMNLALQVARHMENLAVRMVYESNVLDKKTKQLYYRNLLYADESGKRQRFGENGARKTHQWFLKSVFGSSYKNHPTIDRSGAVSFPPETDDPFQDFTPLGHTESILAALPGKDGDPYLESLKKRLFKDNEVLGNIILVARREFCRGYDENWEEYPDIPHSFCLSDLIEEV